MNIAPAPTSISTITPPRRGRHARRVLLGLCLGVCALLAPCTGVLAASPTAQGARPTTTAPAVPPEWERLTVEQREAVIAVLRDRWNANPGQRARMLEHAKRWQTMTPEQRRLAERGLSRWSRMSPEERAKVRERFHARDGSRMTPDQRRALRETLRGMTPEQRREWLRKKRAERHSSTPADTATTPAR